MAISKRINVLEKEILIWNALLDMYANLGSLSTLQDNDSASLDTEAEELSH